ncbi:MAG: hypothetical protein FJ252_00140 [Phycisphaerae bacterium]|nr:hypothetical protein [Phycisphaerae bacterium]
MGSSRVTPASVGASDVRVALLDLKASTQDVLAAVPGLTGFRPVDIEGALGIDLKLAWKLSHLAHAGDPFDAVRHLPGELAAKIAAQAAAKKGVPAAKTEAMMAALFRVQSLGIAWSGGKRAFGLLSANMATNADGRFAVDRRKELFSGGMHVWGMRAANAFRVDVLHPAARGKMIDCLTLRGFADLERLRFDAAWRFDAPVVVDDRGRASRRARLERPAGTASSSAPFIIDELCSGASKTLKRVAEDGCLHLMPGEVGRASAGTLVQGAVMRHVQPQGLSRDHSGLFQVFRARTPCVMQEFVVGVHRSLVPEGVQPDAVVYGDLYGAPERRMPYHLGDRLHCGATVQVLAARSRWRIEGVVGVEGWIDRQLDALGWDRDDMLWFRAAVAYPPIPSTLVVQLPQAD